MLLGNDSGSNNVFGNGSLPHHDKDDRALALTDTIGNSAGDGNTFEGNGINFNKRQTNLLSDLLSPLNSNLDGNSASGDGSGNGNGNAAGNGRSPPSDASDACRCKRRTSTDLVLQAMGMATALAMAQDRAIPSVTVGFCSRTQTMKHR